MMISDDDCAMYSIPPCVCVGLSTHQNQQNCVFVSAEPVVGAPTHRAISRPAYLHRARARFFQARDPWCKGLMFRCLFGAYYGDVNLTAAEYQQNSTGLTFWRAYDSKPGDPPFSNKKSVLNKRLQPGVSTTGFSAAQHTS